MTRISLVEAYDNRDTVTQVLKAIDTSNHAVDVADESVKTSDTAVSKATTAQSAADEAQSKADNAVVTANDAVAVANSIDGKAQLALDTAKDADATANAIAGMAEEALDKSTDVIITATEANNDANNALSKASTAQSTADESMAKVNAILNDPVTIVGPITTANPLVYNPTTPVTSNGRFQNLLRVNNPDTEDFVFAYCNYATSQNMVNLSLATPNGTQMRLVLRTFEDDSAVLYLQNSKTGARKDIVKLDAPNSSPSMLSMASTFNESAPSPVMDDAPVRYNY